MFHRSKVNTWSAGCSGGSRGRGRGRQGRVGTGGGGAERQVGRRAAGSFEVGVDGGGGAVEGAAARSTQMVQHPAERSTRHAANRHRSCHQHWIVPACCCRRRSTAPPLQHPVHHAAPQPHRTYALAAVDVVLIVLAVSVLDVSHPVLLAQVGQLGARRARQPHQALQRAAAAVCWRRGGRPGARGRVLGLGHCRWPSSGRGLAAGGGGVWRGRRAAAVCWCALLGRVGWCTDQTRCPCSAEGPAVHRQDRGVGSV